MWLPIAARGRPRATSGVRISFTCSVIIQAAEEALDDIAQAIEPPIMTLLALGRNPHGDNGQGSIIADRLTDGLAVIGLVGDHGQRGDRMLVSASLAFEARAIGRRFT